MHWLSHWSGADGSNIYNLMSGIVPDLALIVGITAFLRRHNCHEQRCWRLTRHTHDGLHITCHRHHN